MKLNKYKFTIILTPSHVPHLSEFLVCPNRFCSFLLYQHRHYWPPFHSQVSQPGQS